MASTLILYTLTGCFLMVAPAVTAWLLVMLYKLIKAEIKEED